jgi:hypothetical protein
MPDRRTLLVITLALLAGAAAAQQAPPPGARGTIEPPNGVFVPATAAQRDLSALPAPVVATRARIVEAAKSGSLDALAALVTANPVRVILEEGTTANPALLWRSQYPDSEGLELLAIVLDLLDSSFVRVNEGRPNELYVWPSYAHLRLGDLTPAQQVELYRLVTAYDYQQMLSVDAYTFFRLGIGPDGVWHYLVSGE